MSLDMVSLVCEEVPGPTVFITLLFLSVSTPGVFGQFCGPYFTLRPAKFELQLISFPARPINLTLTDIINI